MSHLHDDDIAPQWTVYGPLKFFDPFEGWVVVFIPYVFLVCTRLQSKRL